MTDRLLSAATLSLLLVVLGGCTTGDDEPVASPTTAVATPVASLSPSPSASPSPADTADAPDPADALRAADARAQERDDCDTRPTAHEVVAEVADRLLVYVVCVMGAYQPSGELRVWDGSTLAPLPVEQWQFDSVLESSEVIGIVSASPDGETVVNDVKYRGLGDCGMQQVWEFDGTSLLLTLVREQECTDGEDFVRPDQWPTVYSR